MDAFAIVTAVLRQPTGGSLNYRSCREISLTGVCMSLAFWVSSSRFGEKLVSSSKTALLFRNHSQAVPFLIRNRPGAYVEGSQEVPDRREGTDGSPGYIGSQGLF